MNKRDIQIRLEASFHLELNEQELGALDAIFGYGVDAFLKAFRANLGAHYVDKYEAGVRSLHERIRKVTSPALAEIKETRDKLNSALSQP